MVITLTGATGFIGRRLFFRLRADGHELRIVSRSTGPGTYTWDDIATAVEGADGIIHLAGEPVAQRWNDDVKRRILDSRVQTSRKLVEAIGAATRKPATLVSASAVGYYGNRGEEILTERSAPGSGFLPDVCVQWEREASAAERSGVRTAMLRIGIVLGPDGGALEQMLPPFRLGLGGRLGSGEQWMSWIHVDDLIEMLVFALMNGTVRGPVNGVAPEPVRNSVFTKALGRALHRPTIFPVPVMGLKAAFGEMASVLLASQRIVPEAATSAGFRYRLPDLDNALNACVNPQRAGTS